MSSMQITLAYTCLSRASVLISELPRLNLNVVLLLNWAPVMNKYGIVEEKSTHSWRRNRKWVISLVCRSLYTEEQDPNIHQMLCALQSRSEPQQRSHYSDCALTFVRYSRSYCSRCHGHLILSSFWVSKNIKIELYRNIIVPVVLMRVKIGPSTWGCSRIGCGGRYLGLRGKR